MGFHQSLFCSFSDSLWPLLNSNLWKWRLMLSYLSSFNQHIIPFPTKGSKWSHSLLEVFFKKCLVSPWPPNIYSRYCKLSGHSWITGLTRDLWVRNAPRVTEAYFKRKLRICFIHPNPTVLLRRKAVPPDIFWIPTFGIFTTFENIHI